MASKELKESGRFKEAAVKAQAESRCRPGRVSTGIQQFHEPQVWSCSGTKLSDGGRDEGSSGRLC